uniref:Ribonuclease A-domain domain-containing protein n=1 Tax=Sparus aurata TaxID=8175 RepID=A0A671XXT5_SPAAU
SHIKENFIARHAGQVSRDNCDHEMGRRGLITTSDSNLCRDTHTFIGAPASRVKSICERAGAPYVGTLTRSFQSFPIVVCHLKNRTARFPYCQYHGRAETRHLAIQCEQGYPVHFEREIFG